MQLLIDTVNWLCRKARRVVVFVIGMTILLIGIVMIVAPGPAVVVIPIGLAILATEFVWAKKWLDYARARINTVVAYSSSEKSQREDNSPTP